MIKLGTKVTDSITAFEGTAVSRIEYLTGCTQIGVAPKVGKDGKLGDTLYFDESRLDGTDLQKAKELKTIAQPGGPNRDCPR